MRTEVHLAERCRLRILPLGKPASKARSVIFELIHKIPGPESAGPE